MVLWVLLHRKRKSVDHHNPIKFKMCEKGGVCWKSGIPKARPSLQKAFFVQDFAAAFQHILDEPG